MSLTQSHGLTWVSSGGSFRGGGGGGGGGGGAGQSRLGAEAEVPVVR